MYTADQIRTMSGEGFTDLLETLDRRDMEDVFCYAAGWSPEAMAGALNLHARMKGIRAAHAAAPAAPAVADPLPPNEVPAGTSAAVRF